MSSTSDSLVIGTRGSPLALYQAQAVRAALAAAGRPQAEIAVIRTSGDRIQDRALAEAGGKGLFTREIDEAQLAGTVQVAVHSAKDLPTELPEGLMIAGYLPREDARDAFVSLRAADIGALPHGAVVGSASLRRQAMLRRLRPDLTLVLLRGNVGTRLAKMESGAIDATLLAVAGLKRLGLEAHITAMLPLETFLPAVGQGAIAMVTRADDTAARDAVAAIADAATAPALAAERAFLKVLDGSCRTPIAGHATLADGTVSLRGLVLSPDGAAVFEASAEAAEADAARLGHEIGHSIKASLPAGFFG